MGAEERRARRESRQERNRKLKRGVLAIGLGVVLFAALFFVVFGVVLRDGMKPDPVTGLTADACYADITLQWDPVSRASGYYVYSVDGDGKEQIADIPAAKDSKDSGDPCSYSIDKYTKDKEYSFCVSAYGENRLTHRINEGESSDIVTTEYETDKHAQKIPILTYHKVVPAGTEFNTSLLVAEDVLEEHLAYLHDNGFKTLTMDEFYQWYKGKLEVPVKSVVVTFDDGFYGTYHLAYPIFRKFDQAGTVFCIGKHIEPTTADFDPTTRKDYYIGQDVIEGMRTEYPKFEFQSHTYDMHGRVHGKKPALVYSYDQIMEDCAKNAPYGFTYLAYPWGTYSKTMQKAVKDSGYKLAFSYRPFLYATRDDDPYAVNRIKINGKIQMDRFISIVNGEAPEFDEGVSY